MPIKVNNSSNPIILNGDPWIEVQSEAINWLIGIAPYIYLRYIYVITPFLGCELSCSGLRLNMALDEIKGCFKRDITLHISLEISPMWRLLSRHSYESIQANSLVISMKLYRT